LLPVSRPRNSFGHSSREWKADMMNPWTVGNEYGCRDGRPAENSQSNLEHREHETGPRRNERPTGGQRTSSCPLSRLAAWAGPHRINCQSVPHLCTVDRDSTFSSQSRASEEPGVPAYSSLGGRATQIQGDAIRIGGSMVQATLENSLMTWTGAELSGRCQQAGGMYWGIMPWLSYEQHWSGYVVVAGPVSSSG
jgi:hypothetical protein